MIKIIHGSAGERAQVAVQAVFEVVSWLVGAGEAKAGIKAADVASDGAKVSKMADAASDGAKASKNVKISKEVGIK